MPLPLVTETPISAFYQARIPFEAAARNRRQERLDHGDDTPYNFAVIEEMLMALLAENKAIQRRLVVLEEMVGINGTSAEPLPDVQKG